ncbi:hypothetical protein KAS79_04235 [Candidatus Parcubacteria bacterium]|nr:hypothetical protein [Candidatus Parcubacteria bacterium]
MPAGKYKKQDLAYLAGIIDGEGCIQLSKSMNNNRRYTPYSYFSTITVEMGCKDVPEWILKRFGGSLRSRIRKNRRLTMWTWQVSNGFSEELVNHLLPFLVQKKREAELFIEFRKTIKSNRKVALTPKILLFRDLLIRELRGLRKISFPKIYV